MEQEQNIMLSLAMQRYSVRSYTEQPVSDDDFTYMLEVARLAPSAVNFQPWSFVVVRTPELMSQLYTAYPREWFHTVSACIVVCGNHNQSWHRRNDGKDHCDIDVAIATEHLCLAATERGLGTCWICNFDAVVCRDVLQLPEGIEPIVILAVGHPDSAEVAEKKRKSLEEVVVWR